jgi:hypothetical protein
MISQYFTRRLARLRFGGQRDPNARAPGRFQEVVVLWSPCTSPRYSEPHENHNHRSIPYQSSYRGIFHGVCPRESAGTQRPQTVRDAADRMAWL